MGFEVERFLSPPDDEYLCSICLSVFEDPVRGPCGHVFCVKCIENWIPLNVNACPLDKKPLFRKDLLPVCIPFRNQLNRLEIKCDFETSGCVHIAPLHSMNSHIKMCPYNPDGEMICEIGCKLKYLRKDQDTHKCIDALKQLCSQKDIEIADLKRKIPPKRSYDTMRLSEWSERRFYEHLSESTSMHRRLRDFDRFQTRDRPSMFVEGADRAGTSGDSNSPVLQSVITPPQRATAAEADMRNVRVMLRRLTDEQIARRRADPRSDTIRDSRLGEAQPSQSARPFHATLAPLVRSLEDASWP